MSTSLSKTSFFLKILIIFCILGVLGLIYSALQTAQKPQATFHLLDDSTKSLSEFHGQVVLVNFWATSCTGCIAEMPDLVRTHQKFQDVGVEMVAVAMSYDNPSFVKTFAQAHGLPFILAFDKTGEVAKAFGEVQLTPTTFLLNKEGEIVKRYLGAPNFDELHREIEQLVKA